MAIHINRKSISEQLVEYFQQQIESGKYKPGDEFPSERSLEHQLGISRKTISKVVSVLAGMGYLFKEQGKTTFVADFHANRTNFTRARNFGILFSSPADVYHPAHAPVFLALCDMLRATEHGMNLFFSKGASGKMLSSQFRQQPVSGCFVFPDGGEQDLTLSRFLGNIPAVWLCSGEIDLPASVSCVSADVVGACADAVRLLVRTGRKRIAFLFGMENWVCDQKRIDVFRKTMEEEGGSFDPALLAPSHYDRGKTLESLEMVLTRKPNAIIGADDMVASWIVSDLARRSIAVPRQIAVVGFNDMAMYALRCQPELTTFAVPAEEIAKQAVAEMSQRIASPDAPPERTLISMPLIRRGSL